MMDWQRFSNPTQNPERRKRPVIKRKLHFAGYEFTASPEGTVVHREKIDVTAEGDYGADPLGPDKTGEFTWRMVPSGDIVYRDEMKRRLKR